MLSQNRLDYLCCISRTFLAVHIFTTQVTALPQQQNPSLQNHPETDLDLRNPTLWYGFHIQRRNPGTFPIESPTSDRGRTTICAEHYYPTRSPHTNGQEFHHYSSLQPPPQCTPKRHPPNPPRATRTQATAKTPAQRSAYQILV
jgi:hypothetical protein